MSIEKTEEQVDRERRAVASMANAKSNMDHTLARIGTLVSALTLARAQLANAKTYIGPAAYVFPHGGKCETVHALIDRQVASIDSVL